MKNKPTYKYFRDRDGDIFRQREDVMAQLWYKNSRWGPYGFCNNAFWLTYFKVAHITKAAAKKAGVKV